MYFRPDQCAGGTGGTMPSRWYVGTLFREANDCCHFKYTHAAGQLDVKTDCVPSEDIQGNTGNCAAPVEKCTGLRGVETPISKNCLRKLATFSVDANCMFDTFDYGDSKEAEAILHEVARSQYRSCAIRHESGEVRTVILKGRHHQGDIKFGNYRAVIPTMKEEFDKNLTYALGEVFESRETLTSHLDDAVLYYDHNKRIKKFLPSKNVLLSINIISEDNQTIQPAEVTFYYEINASASLMENAIDLTYEDGDVHVMSQTSRVTGYQPQCVYIDEHGKFSSHGCQCEMVGDEAKCISNHTTSFAVLLSVDTVSMSAETKVMSIVMQTISVFFLLVTFFILLRVRKKIRGERVAVQINLVISLAFLHICTLLHDVALHYPALCRAVAVLTHFFLLSSALWMTNEALLLFIKTSRWALVTAKRRKVVVATMAFGWGMAAVVSAVTACVGFPTNAYMKANFIHDLSQNSSDVNVTKILQYDFCWLSPDSGIRWAAIGPVILLLVANTGIAIKVTIFVYRKRKDSTNFRVAEQSPNNRGLDMESFNSISAALKAFIILLPTLGMPWLLMLSANVSDDTTRVGFLHANIILNGLQGVFVFIVYCVVGEDVRTAAIKSISSLIDTWPSIPDTSEKRRKKNTNTAPAADNVTGVDDTAC